MSSVPRIEAVRIQKERLFTETLEESLLPSEQDETAMLTRWSELSLREEEHTEESTDAAKLAKSYKHEVARLMTQVTLTDTTTDQAPAPIFEGRFAIERLRPM